MSNLNDKPLNDIGDALAIAEIIIKAQAKREERSGYREYLDEQLGVIRRGLAAHQHFVETMP